MKRLILAFSIALASMTAIAQSAFEGFYGQIASGYEKNNFSNINPNWANLTQGGILYSISSSAPSQGTSGAPIPIGIGYLKSITNSFLLGVGIDYSPTSQQTGNFSHNSIRSDGITFPFNNMSYKVSNKLNVYFLPSYAFDKEKLGYLKLGYSTQQLQYQQNSDVESSGLESGFTSKKNMNGYVLGLGYKQIIQGGFYGFAEGNFYSYSKATLTGYGTAQGSTIGMSSSPSINSYQFLVGVGYRF